MEKIDIADELNQKESFGSIEKRLTLAFGGLVFVLMFVVYLTNSYMDERKFEFERNSLASTIAATIAISIEKVSFGGRYQSSQFVEKITLEDPRIIFMFMLDSDHNIVASSNEYTQVKDNTAFVGEILSAFALKDGNLKNEIVELKDNIIVIKKEVNSGYKGEIKNELLVGIQVDESQFFHNMNTFYTTISIIILTFVSLFVIRGISSYIGHPVKNLAWKFYNILKYSPVLIHIHDKGGRIIESSASFKENFGESGNIYDVIPSEYREKHKEINDQVFREGKSLFVSSKFNSLGRSKYFLVNKFPIEKNDNEINLICGFSIDITKQKELEDGLKRKGEELEEINKTLQKKIEEEVKKSKQRDEIIYEQNKKNALGELLVNIAHQWRQPLNLIGLQLQNISDMVEYDEIDKDKILEMTEVTMEHLEHLSSVITKFTDFYEGNRKEERVFIKNALNNAIDFMQQSLDVCHITIQSEITPEFLEISGEQGSISEIFLALIINVKEITEVRKLTDVTMWIKIYEDGEYIAIDVKDNAGGIDEKVLPHIFDPYTTTHFKSRNRGLGLYTVKNSIEYRFLGTIKASNVDGGALFEIRLKKGEIKKGSVFAEDGYDE